MNKKLMPLLACPVCKGPLEFAKKQKELICQRDALAFPVRSGVPVLLEIDARKIEQSNLNK